MGVILFIGALAVQPVSWDERCFQDRTENGIQFRAYIGDRACVPFADQRTFEGVWTKIFEGSAFFEGARGLGDMTQRHDSIWLSTDAQTEIPPGLAAARYGHAYRVRFVGKPAKDMHRKPCIDGYGHMGCSAGLVLVDRFIELVDLGPLPQRPPLDERN